MIRVETETSGVPCVKFKADFRAIRRASGDVDEFTNNCGIELMTTVLAAIVSAQNEYLRILQGMAKKQLDAELKNRMNETIFKYVQDIDLEDIDKFRELVTD